MGHADRAHLDCHYPLRSSAARASEKKKSRSMGSVLKLVRNSHLHLLGRQALEFKLAGNSFAFP